MNKLITFLIKCIIIHIFSDGLGLLILSNSESSFKSNDFDGVIYVTYNESFHLAIVLNGI